MAPKNEATGALRHFRGSPEQLSQHVEGQAIARPAYQVEPEQRGGAHRVDVTHRIGNGDCPPRPRIVDNGGKKVHRRHQGSIGGQQKYSGVVAGGGVDQDPRIPDNW
jgi:hypothetical protein